MQRKRSACESFIDDERLFKSNKTANNLGPVSTNPPDRPIKLPSNKLAGLQNQHRVVTIVGTQNLILTTRKLYCRFDTLHFLG